MAEDKGKAAEATSAPRPLIKLHERTKLVKDLFIQNAKVFGNSLPRTLGLSSERMLRVQLNAVVYNPDLMECTLPSLFGGIMEACRLGLEIGGSMGHCWLVPFKDGDKRIATFVLGYQGMITVAARCRSVHSMFAYAVHQDDEYDVVLGDTPRIMHKPKTPVTTFEELYACYAVAVLKGGVRQVWPMTRKEILLTKARSRAKFGPWSHPQDSVAMAIKTPLRRLYKQIPKTAEEARAVELDERQDVGLDQVFDMGDIVLPADPAYPETPAVSPQLEAGTPSGGSLMDQLKSTLQQKEGVARS
jgi:recombination protein RecT